MGVIRCAESFYCDDIGAFEVDDFLQAGTHCFPIDDNGTGSALAFPVAGLLGAGEIKVFT
jgi:hypothetical protein